MTSGAPPPSPPPPPHMTPAAVRRASAENPDRLAQEFLPPGSFARHAYMEKSIVKLRLPHGPDNADAEECARWGLSPEQWAEAMEAALLAQRHDCAIDLRRAGERP